jgi:putative methyltransferase (TIGR04325 family)
MKRVLDGAREMLPPGLASWLRYRLHHSRGDATLFEGRYSSWAAAAAATNGYFDPAILERTRQATRQARDNPRIFERDSVVLPHPEYPLEVLAALLHVGNMADGRLDVVDFGGALGSTYFQLQSFLKPLQKVRWTVVEQSHYVECGRREFTDDRLRFQPTVQEAVSETTSQILLLSGVLQYLPNPQNALRELLAQDIPFVLLDRTAFHREQSDRLTVQHNPHSIYPASYPAWFFNEAQFLAQFHNTHELLFDFDAHDQVLLERGRAYYRGYLFHKKQPT